ncbi:hypothetical protein STEG23_023388, partial [Scotinomys teguina]
KRSSHFSSKKLWFAKYESHYRKPLWSECRDRTLDVFNQYGQDKVNEVSTMIAFNLENSIHCSTLGVEWHLTVDLICILLITDNAEQLAKLNILVSSFVKHLFKHLVCFSAETLTLSLSGFKSPSYVLRESSSPFRVPQLCLVIYVYWNAQYTSYTNPLAESHQRKFEKIRFESRTHDKKESDNRRKAQVNRCGTIYWIMSCNVGPTFLKKIDSSQHPLIVKSSSALRGVRSSQHCCREFMYATNLKISSDVSTLQVMSQAAMRCPPCIFRKSSFFSGDWSDSASSLTLVDAVAVDLGAPGQWGMD